MKSIITDKKECFVGRTTLNLEEHHIFRGANRNNSEKYGLKVWLCHEHHQGATGVHGGNKWLDTMLKKLAQNKFEERFPEHDFREIFHGNYR